MYFLRTHPVAVVIALIVVAAIGYVIFDLFFAGGADFDPVMR